MQGVKCSTLVRGLFCRSRIVVLYERDLRLWVEFFLVGGQGYLVELLAFGA